MAFKRMHMYTIYMSDSVLPILPEFEEVYSIKSKYRNVCSKHENTKTLYIYSQHILSRWMMIVDDHRSDGVKNLNAIE